MRTFLLWKADPNLAGVEKKLRRIFAPLFSENLSLLCHSTRWVEFACVQMPVKGWQPAFHQEDDDSWVLSVEYPLNARTVLSSLGISFSEDNVLLVLARELQKDTRRVLKDLSPPFSLVWGNKACGEIFFQNDGLGMAQTFEMREGSSWALTDRVFPL